MDKETIIEAMASQNILAADLSDGPTAVIITKDRSRPKCIVIRADGEDFTADVPAFFGSKKLRITRAEVAARAERDRKLKEFLAGQD
ncbi:MAG: hypothetical protein ACOX81_01095 [Candidatus Heteroscillospira sp.]|jgi:hypothetical protein